MSGGKGSWSRHLMMNTKKGEKQISTVDEVTWHFLLFVLIAAVCFDWKHYCIPNWLIAAGYGIGLLYQFVCYGWMGCLLWFQGMVFPIAVLFIFFYCKMLGAGDIKLFSVLGGVIGVFSIIDVMIVSLFFGGLLSVIFVVRHKNLKNRLQYLLTYFSDMKRQKKIVPYIYKADGYSRKEHIAQGHVHYSAAIFGAVIFCRWQYVFEQVINICLHKRF